MEPDVWDTPVPGIPNIIERNAVRVHIQVSAEPAVEKANAKTPGRRLRYSDSHGPLCPLTLIRVGSAKLKVGREKFERCAIPANSV